MAVCFVTGAAMELFMISTGFYDVVKRKEMERRALERHQQEEYWLERRRREQAAQMQAQISSNAECPTSSVAQSSSNRAVTPAQTAAPS